MTTGFAWNSASQAVHKICICHIMTVDLPVLLENWTKFVNLQGSVKDSPIVVSRYLRFFSSLTKSVSFGSLHSTILKLKPLVDLSGSEGYDGGGGAGKVEIIIRFFFFFFWGEGCRIHSLESVQLSAYSFIVLLLQGVSFHTCEARLPWENECILTSAQFWFV